MSSSLQGVIVWPGLQSLQRGSSFGFQLISQCSQIGRWAFYLLNRVKTLCSDSPSKSQLSPKNTVLMYLLLTMSDVHQHTKRIQCHHLCLQAYRASVARAKHASVLPHLSPNHPCSFSRQSSLCHANTARNTKLCRHVPSVTNTTRNSARLHLRNSGRLRTLT